MQPQDLLLGVKMCGGVGKGSREKSIKKIKVKVHL